MNDKIFKNLDELQVNLEIELSRIRTMVGRFKNSEADLMVKVYNDGSLGIEIHRLDEVVGFENCTPHDVATTMLRYHGK